MFSDKDGPRITMLDDSSSDDGEVPFVSASSKSPANGDKELAGSSTMQLDQNVAVVVNSLRPEDLMRFKAIPGEDKAVKIAKEYKFKGDLSYRVKFRDGHFEKVCLELSSHFIVESEMIFVYSPTDPLSQPI
jgi:hypothetical protein